MSRSLLLSLVSAAVWTPVVHAQAKPSPGATETKAAIVSYVNPAELVSSPRYSHAALVQGARLVLVSGELALDAKGELVGRDDFRKQAAQVFANVRHALAACGASPSDVVAIETYYVNRADLPAYRDARTEFFAGRAGPPPTSTTVQVAGLVAEGALLEVSVTAVLPAQADTKSAK